MKTNTFTKIFKVKKPIIGMIHVPALPGTPANILKPEEIISHCLKEATKLKKGGMDGIMIENMHDLPYLKKNIGPEIVGMMSVVGHEVKKATQLPCGIQILAGANMEALAVAQAGGLDFIRAEGFVFGHIADEGYMDADAGELLRYRKQIGAEHILVFTDIKKKHSSHSLTNDIDIVETAKAAEYFLSDGLIVTGKSTGETANIDEINQVKSASNLPVIVGSGITIDNVSDYLKASDAIIVNNRG